MVIFSESLSSAGPIGIASGWVGPSDSPMNTGSSTIGKRRHLYGDCKIVFADFILNMLSRASVNNFLC